MTMKKFLSIFRLLTTCSKALKENCCTTGYIRKDINKLKVIKMFLGSEFMISWGATESKLLEMNIPYFFLLYTYMISSFSCCLYKIMQTLRVTSYTTIRNILYSIQRISIFLKLEHSMFKFKMQCDQHQSTY